MPLNYSEGEVLENNNVIDNIYKLKLKGKFEGKPGQFYMLRAWDRDPYLSRPLSISDIDNEGITFLYEVKGKGTENFKNLKENDKIKFLGPLGRGFETDKIKGDIAVAAGGIGIAPMIFLIKSLKDCRIHLYAGFRDEVYAVDELKEYIEKSFITTNSGKYGYRGFVTDLLNPQNYNGILCCGPKPMMEKVAKMSRLSGTPCLLSMEENMACGIGACLVCTCSTREGSRRVCKDGPVFSGRDVIFNACS